MTHVELMRQFAREVEEEHRKNKTFRVERLDLNQIDLDNHGIEPETPTRPPSNRRSGKLKKFILLKCFINFSISFFLIFSP